MRTALVTGASRGIGREIALALASEGCAVGVNYNTSPKEAEKVCAIIQERGGQAAALKADVADRIERKYMFDAFLDQFGNIDILINNAGITRYKPFMMVKEEDFLEVMDLDWRGTYFCTQRAAKEMAAAGRGGSIVNVVSVLYEINFPYASVYGPAKAAVEKFTRQAALELSPYGIRVNAVSPGTIKSDVLQNPEYTPRQKALASRIPFGKLGTPADVANAVCFLVSDRASYITGTNLFVDGGAHLPAVLDNAKETPDMGW